MAVMRIHKNKNYTVISNVHLRDKRISLKAKGLLTLMLSLPEDWDYSVEGLSSICKENRTAIQSALKELEECHYLKRTRERNEKGQFDCIYNIFEEPQEEQLRHARQYRHGQYLGFIPRSVTVRFGFHLHRHLCLQSDQ